VTSDDETWGIVAAAGPAGHRAAAHIDGETQTIEVACECGWSLAAHSRDNVSQGFAARAALFEHQARAVRA
jgi:hypothetical protein